MYSRGVPITMWCSGFSLQEGDTHVSVHPLKTSSETPSRGAGGGALSLLCLDGLEIRFPENSNPWFCQ